MLHSRKLHYIDQIARCGSIRKAASRLNVASSSINRQIIALEEEIGAPIFERLPRGLRLTAAGELFVEHIRGVMKDYQRLEARVRGLKAPQVGRVSMITTVGLAAGPLPAILARFMEEHPRVNIRLRTDGQETVINAVLTGEVDLGLGLNLSAAPGIRTLAHFEVPLGLVVPPGNALAHQKDVHLADAIEQPLVLAHPNSSLRDLINLVLAPLNTPVEPVLESTSIEMLKQLVKMGTAVTFMNPLDVMEDCRRGELVFLPLVDKHIRKQPLKLVARARSPFDATASVFVEHLTTVLADLIGQPHSE